MLKINVTREVKGYQGESIPFNERPATTYRDLILQCLNQAALGETLSAEDRVTAFRLSTLVCGDEIVAIDPGEDVAFIMRRSGLVNPPLAHGRLKELFDSAESAIETDPLR